MRHCMCAMPLHPLHSSLGGSRLKNPHGASLSPSTLGNNENKAESTVLNPLVKVFGFSNVVHRPSEKASMAGASFP